MRFWYAMCYNFIESFTVLHLVSSSHKFRKNVMVSRGFSGFMLCAIMFAGKPQIFARAKRQPNECHSIEFVVFIMYCLKNLFLKPKISRLLIPVII